MRIHKPIILKIAATLEDIFEKGYYADKAIEYHIKKSGPKWGSRDRKFFAQTVYDIVRWYRKITEALPTSLRANHWAVLEAWFILQGYDYPEMNDFPRLKKEALESQFDRQNQFAILASYPDWMVEKLNEELGAEKCERILTAMNQSAEIFLRCNELQGSREQLVKELEAEGISVRIVPESPSALMLNQRKNVFITKAFKRGAFEVQDLGSQAIAPLLEVEPGQRVLDACAGAGGKSLHLAQLMNNKGKVVATDIHERKLQQLKKRAKRNRIDLVESRLVDRKWTKRQKGKFDRLLLDVPCSGLGVIKRNPDTKWKLTPDRLPELLEVQRQILLDHHNVVKPGGKMVYATCSVLPSENQDQVRWFLKDHPEWELEEELILTPDHFLGDGFYAARLAHVRR
ncbi:MAG: methyltransferase domain-containing protein [Bdellovibrionales bacterium]